MTRNHAILGVFVILMLIAISCGESVDSIVGQGPRKIVMKEPSSSPKKVEVDLESLPDKPLVLVSTTAGDITIELFKNQAPVTVKNFLTYVISGHYNGTLIHRIAPGFVLQGGGYDRGLYENPRMTAKTPRDPIKNEADNGLKNLKGTLSMARKPGKDTATCQFFINLKDNKALDHKDNYKNDKEFGYAVFAKVIEGWEVVEKIAHLPTKTFPPKFRRKEFPVEPVVILSASRKDA